MPPHGRRTAHPHKGKNTEAHRHKPDVQKPVHNDSGQCKADAGFHPAAHKDRPEHIAQVQGQHGIDGIAPRQAAQHDTTPRTLINADKLFPPQQAEGMPGQDQHHGKQQKCQRHCRFPLSSFFFFCHRMPYSSPAAATAYPAMNGAR